MSVWHYVFTLVTGAVVGVLGAYFYLSSQPYGKGVARPEGAFLYDYVYMCPSVDGCSLRRDLGVIEKSYQKAQGDALERLGLR